jgi:hypothetical protein
MRGPKRMSKIRSDPHRFAVTPAARPTSRERAFLVGPCGPPQNHSAGEYVEQHEQIAACWTTSASAREKTDARRATAQMHRPSRRRGCGVAARTARAGTKQTPSRAPVTTKVMQERARAPSINAVATIAPSKHSMDLALDFQLQSFVPVLSDFTQVQGCEL